LFRLVNGVGGCTSEGGENIAAQHDHTAGAYMLGAHPTTATDIRIDVSTINIALLDV
jgi:hypothetical protein